MIIWVDGAYGFGKIAICQKMTEFIPNAYLYNSENVRHNLPESFQEPIFRIIRSGVSGMFRFCCKV
ncbi:hypothetical protein ACWOAH_06675 [Vagococcus vulneris]|uniref:Uncharacterized protein n=1 Tax=Vagococcus vulneris TaxID=1977869 RepID=A0A429ZY60_9ENTE|nr:hypothetical protein [Vagococcus vulneris]RST98890.1 hypothetical protein CBF37_05835 [Vagococcus vulneris]